LTTGGIDDLCAKVLTQNGIMGVRRVLKADLKRIARGSGGVVLTSATALDVGSDANLDAAGDVFANTTEESAVKAITSYFGAADSVSVERVSGDDELIIFRGLKKHASASIIIRGPNEYFVDEIERSVHDALCAAKRVLESKALVPGAGWYLLFILSVIFGLLWETDLSVIESVSLERNES
jgi:T-complex protein 1 subunit alpha